MKLRNNFYFYFSIGAIIFIFIIVFYLYEMEYKLSSFLDTKTVLQVLGTLGGAYYGAKIAGKYSVNVMLDQYELQKLDEQKKFKVRENRKNLYIHISVNSFITNVNFLLTLSKTRQESDGYLNSMEESIEEMSKVVLIFDNMDYLDIEEKLIPKYMKIQIYLKGLLSSSNNLRDMHVVFEKHNKPLLEKINESEINPYLEEVTLQMIELKKELQDTVDDIKWYMPT